MFLVCRCDECKELILKRSIRYTCKKCGARFCSLTCQENHHCIGLPILRLLWEDDIEFEANKFDIIKILKMLLEYERSNSQAKTEHTEVSENARCVCCYGTENIIWQDIELGPLCADCFNELRTNVLKDIRSQTNDTGVAIDQFRIIRVPAEPKTRPTHLLTICMAKMDLEARFYKDITLETKDGLRKQKFELYDFKVWEVSGVTIIHVDGRILEFAPGTYLIIRDE